MNAKVMAAVVVVLGLTGCGSGVSTSVASTSRPSASAAATPTVDRFNVGGYVSVQPDFVAMITAGQEALLDGPCTAAEGYSDIAEGTQVVVADAAGVTLGVGRLTVGVLTGQPGKPIYTTRCRFGFLVPLVPTGESFYGVNVGRRGTLQYTEAELQAGNLELTIG